MTLYELTDEFRQLLDMMEDPDIDQEVLNDTLEAVLGDIEYKADGYAIVIGELTAKASHIADEIKRLNDWKKHITENVDRMKMCLMKAMDATWQKKIETEHFRISVRTNGGLQPMEITGDVPAEYCKLEPDNTKIRGALADGIVLDFAHLNERGRSVVIK